MSMPEPLQLVAWALLAAPAGAISAVLVSVIVEAWNGPGARPWRRR